MQESFFSATFVALSLLVGCSSSSGGDTTPDDVDSSTPEDTEIVDSGATDTAHGDAPSTETSGECATPSARISRRRRCATRRLTSLRAGVAPTRNCDAPS